MSLIDVRTRWMREARRVEPGAGERLVVAATFTADPIVPYLGVAYADATGVPPRIEVAPYGQVLQLGHDWRAVLGEAGPEPAAIVLLWRIEDLLRPSFQGWLRGEAGAWEEAQARLAALGDAVAALRVAFGGAIVVGAPAFPHGPDHHGRAARSTREAGRFHRRVTEWWLDRVEAIGGVDLLDLDAVARHLGVERALDSRKWYLYRQPFAEAFWSELGGDLARLLARRRGAAKKCLVLDCDGTLWGGIVGEDGLAGVRLGEDFPGSAHRDAQNLVLTLRAQGVLIALCSKNDEADVWAVFDRHDGMVLRREHVAAHRIDWRDKAANLVEIAAELNIGLDAMVFVDDSAIEVERVRAALPAVTCLLVPEDVAAFPAALAELRLFDRDHVSDEDRARSAMMGRERERRDLARDLDPSAFRAALGLVVDLFPVAPEHVARVAQLANKTNQFNLTDRRRAADEFARLAASPDHEVLALRVADRFGEYGLVGVVVLERGREDDGEVLAVETFLMSCRVLGRGVETAVLAGLADRARRLGAARLRGIYVATGRNGQVADLYARHGFREVGDGVWESDDLAAVPDALPWPAHVARAGL